MANVLIFTKEEFEAALPCHKDTSKQLWTYEGIENNEHCYSINIPGGKPHRVFIRSSVGLSGLSATCGEDSIRIWLEEKRPIGIGNREAWAGVKKKQRWVTRVTGWQERVVNVCRETYRLGVNKVNLESAAPLCPKCQTEMRIRFRKSDDNPFWGCPGFPACRGTANVKVSAGL